MNCDQAFEAMTEPTGTNGADLQIHLQSCRRCREMAEVLSPVMVALRETAETLDTFESKNSLASQESIRVATNVATQFSRRPERRRNRASHKTWLQLGAAFFSGSVLALGVAFWQPAEEPMKPFLPAMSAQDCTWQRHDDSLQHASPKNLTLTCVACHLPSQPR